MRLIKSLTLPAPGARRARAAAAGTFLLFLLLVGEYSRTQGQGKGELPADTLAVVASGVITAADLIERIELMPYPGKERQTELDSVKIRALQSMVAERLLAGEAAVQGRGSDSLTLLRLDGLERAFVRDELYKKEVAAGVSVGQAELDAGMRMYARELRIVIFRCSTEESARRIAWALRQGIRGIDSVSSAGFHRGLLSRDTVTLDYGVADESIEAPAYALDPEHRVSSPFRSPMLGWVVVSLVDGRTNPAFAAQSVNNRILTVKNTITRRKAQVKGLRYMASVLDPRRAEADTATLIVLGKALFAIIASDSAAHRAEGRFLLTPGEVDRLEEMLRGDLSRVLVNMPGGGLTLGRAVQAFRLEPFTTPSLQGRTFALFLNESVKRIVREEFLTREGYAKNLQRSASVQHDLGQWRDNWLAHMMIAEAVPGAEPTEEEEIRGMIEYARLLSPGYEVNVREIFTDSLAKAGRYRDTLLAGYDMAALARRVSKRRGWSERGGESRFFYVRSFPEIGVRALVADTGKLVGPVAVAGGYSLFRVLGKRLAAGDGAVTVDSLRKALRDVIRSDIRRQKLDRVIAGLAEKFGVKMYYERLKNVDIPGHSMFTRRYIGFGGMMNAAPLLKPEWGWVREYERAGTEVP